MAIKRFLLLYLSISIFLLAGHQDAVHHFLHGLDSHHESNLDTQSYFHAVKSEPHSSCWIEDFLQHRSHQTHLAFSHVSLVEPTVDTQTLFHIYQFAFKNGKKFSKLARGPPAVSFI